MDVRRWPIDKIMELPDWCFGQKWWVGTYVGTTADTPEVFIMEESIPDIFVLWDVLVGVTGVTDGTHANLTLRLCGQIPVFADIQKYDRLMRGVSRRTQTYDFYMPPAGLFHLGPMKTVIEAGNNLIGGALKIVAETVACENSVNCLISGIPREVPDWVVSGCGELELKKKYLGKREVH